MKNNIKLKIWLFENNMTQKELANKAGITEATLTKLIKGERLPSILTAKKIKDITGIRVEDWV